MNGEIFSNVQTTHSNKAEPYSGGRALLKKHRPQQSHGAATVRETCTTPLKYSTNLENKSKGYQRSALQGCQSSTYISLTKRQ